MGTVGEICVLVKYSPKREKMLGKINENIEGTFDETNRAIKLDKLCVTRWTVRANCFKKVIENYEALLTLWKDSLNENLNTETKARIIGCKKQMESFSFFFGLNLGRKLYAHTDNLSKTLQKENMSAIKGQELAELTMKVLQGMRNDRDYDLFYSSVTKAATSVSDISNPAAPRKRKRPRYNILQFVEGNPRPSGEAYYPETAHAHFKAIYMEAIDVIVSSVKDRFNQPAFKVFSQVEQLLLKATKECIAEEIKMVNSSFKDDFDHSTLPCELEVLPVVFKSKAPASFADFVQEICLLSREKRMLIANVVTIIRLVLTNGATSATPERSFSMMRRIKTWLRSTMSQKRLNSLSILQSNRLTVDKLSLIDVANEFVNNQPTRQQVFGKFTEKDI